MTVSEILSASSRRVIMALGVAAMLCATSGVRAQDAAKPADKPDQLKFDYDGPMVLIYQIKPDRAADFEALWIGLRAGLAKSDDADLKAFGETLYPYKVEGASVYVFRLDSPSKKFTYDPIKMIYEHVNYDKPEKGLFTRAEADALYNKFNGAQEGIAAWKLKKVGG